MDPNVPIVDTARELACLIYLMVTRGQKYAVKCMEIQESQRLGRKFSSLRRQAKMLGFQLVAAPSPRTDQVIRGPGFPADWVVPVVRRLCFAG